MSWFPCWLLLVLASLTLTATAAFARAEMPPLQVDDLSEHLSLSAHVELLEDAQGTLQFDDVRSGVAAEKFAAPAGGKTNFGFSHSTWWVRFTLRNSSDRELSLILREEYPLLDHIDFWRQSPSGAWERTRTGDHERFAEREVNFRDFLFPLTLRPFQQQTYYMRVQSSGAVDIALSLHKPVAFLESVSNEQLALGLYYGGLLALVVYNLFMFLAIKDRTFAYYLMYVTSYGLYMAVHNGLTFQFLWPNNPWLANQGLIMLLALSIFFGLQFSRAILRTDRVAPRADRVAYWMQVLSALAVLASPFLAYGVLVMPISVLTLVVVIHLMVMGILSLMAGSRPAKYYVSAWSALLVGVVVYMLKTFGWLPHNAFTQNGFQIGALIEMLLLSLALGSRVNELQRQTYTDPLTGLFNRRYFDDRLHRLFARANETKRPLSLLVIDIDHFKQFNDSHGHAAGDTILTEVGGVIRRSLRKPHAACRYGGEEFVVMLPETDNADAQVLAERVRHNIEQSVREEHAISVSVGVATYDGRTFDHVLTFFEAADFALYTAKERGRNRVVDYRDCVSRRHEDSLKGNA